jgi:hypothetical protein
LSSAASDVRIHVAREDEALVLEIARRPRRWRPPAGGSKSAPWPACQPRFAHRAPVGHRDRVELQVNLGGEIEGDTLGPLRLDHAPVLLEDRVSKSRSTLRRLLEVVVAARIRR